ncbi:MAG TPA: FeoC-like transcriptional regulator [Candidatus Lustribacter sp.]|nr:FeoC-like transcriptional regulator [Candidatus Lustribacter sp.]
MSTAPARGPMHRVVDALATGAASRSELATMSGLPRDVADAVLDHLVRIGRVGVDSLGVDCPDQGCGACPGGRAGAQAGCGSSGPGRSRGPVAMSLRPLLTRTEPA